MELDADLDALRGEVLALAPWYLDVEVVPGLRTSAYLDAPRRPGTAEVTVSVHSGDAEPQMRTAFVPEGNAAGTEPGVQLLDPREEFVRTLEGVYPDGLGGRSVLDCACNCGGYLFWSRELGAGPSFGFDVREHWVRQARFLAEQRERPGEMRFEVCDLYDLPKAGLEQFDVTLFNGVFYHLPDPIEGLRIAASLTREVLVVNTGARSGLPDGALVSADQPRSHLTSGTYGIRWMPTGPRALARLLRWMGFAEVRCTWWRRQPGAGVRDRLEVVAARSEGFLRDLDRSHGTGAERTCSIIGTTVAPETSVLVVSGGDEDLLRVPGRYAYHFPLADDGGRADPRLSGAEAVSHLESLRARGAEYIVFPAAAFGWLEERPELARHLADRCWPVRESAQVRIYALTPTGAEASQVVRDLARERSGRLRPPGGAAPGP